jgi:hypothetical protein
MSARPAQCVFVCVTRKNSFFGIKKKQFHHFFSFLVTASKSDFDTTAFLQLLPFPGKKEESREKMIFSQASPTE